ncbi:hypothetical protein [Marinobacter sp. KMM 10035]|uniref:hypothetical protein n=1 Tax=Marinobacter sp. KMM 10035 TaxID=3134034 RepID=UPI003978F0BE
MTTEHPNLERYWLHRRSMAYISLAALLSIMIAMFAGRIQVALLPLAETLCWVFCVNLLYYYGGNAAEVLAKRGRP